MSAQRPPFIRIVCSFPCHHRQFVGELGTNITEITSIFQFKLRQTMKSECTTQRAKQAAPPCILYDSGRRRTARRWQCSATFATLHRVWRGAAISVGRREARCRTERRRGMHAGLSLRKLRRGGVRRRVERSAGQGRGGLPCCCGGGEGYCHCRRHRSSSGGGEWREGGRWLN